ncbi:MAG: hypothetical protein ACREBH_00120 [Candidatus Micrarchaeaceae archaeon]
MASRTSSRIKCPMCGYYLKSGLGQRTHATTTRHGIYMKVKCPRCRRSSMIRALNGPSAYAKVKLSAFAVASGVALCLMGAALLYIAIADKSDMTVLFALGIPVLAFGVLLAVAGVYAYNISVKEARG